MELVTLRTDNIGGETQRGQSGTVVARAEGDTLYVLEAGSLRAVLDADDGVEAAAERTTGETINRATANFAPVVPNPDKIVCVGINYMDHIEETGSVPPPYPTYFAKYRAALAGPFDNLVLPPSVQSTDIDWECELAIVIGRRARNVSGDEALAAIGGFTVLNDVSVRDWQRRTSQFLAGKNFEKLTPLGPSFISADELGDGSGLTIRTTVNGIVKQQSSTSQLVFNTVDIVSDLSTIMTLEPGDVIATGTPGGVGAARNPPEFLKPGDELITEVEGIGKMVNRRNQDSFGGKRAQAHDLAVDVDHRCSIRGRS